MDKVIFSHKSVLLNECIEALHIQGDKTYIDCTTGGGGHSFEIAARLTKGGRLLCLDRDETALTAAKQRLAPYKERITFVHSNFSELSEVLKSFSVDNLGGVLMDLGCSSYQLDTAERGFSYQQDARLDMRMDETSPLDAEIVVNTYSEGDLRRILFEYGEERYASRIAAAIVRHRMEEPIKTTGALSSIVRSAMPPKAFGEAQHPAKRTFQAIRIEVNGELSAIAPAIDAAARSLTTGGRIAVISFHSLEDRIVKETFRTLSSGCTCPKDFPVCVCGKKPLCKVLTKKPILPTDEELAANPRSRSAKLRVVERTPD